MAYVYPAGEDAPYLREIFGAELETVTFYDRDYPQPGESHWEVVIGQLEDGTEVKKYPGTEEFLLLEEIAEGWDETVKFIIQL